MNHLKSILNNKKDGRNSSILFFYLFKLLAGRCFHAEQKKMKHYDYEESCGFYNNSNVFRKKDELKGVRNWFRTPFLSFLGERL